MRKKFSRITTLVCLPLLACGGGSDSKTVKLTDAKTFLDAAASDCTAPSSYAMLGNMGGAEEHPAGSAAEYQRLFTTLGSADATLTLLFSGGTKWPGGQVGSGTFALDSDDAQLDSCDLCVILGIGAFTGTSIKIDFSDAYFASAGTITISQDGSGSVGSGSGKYLVGTFANVNLRRVDIDTTANTQMDHPGNCTTTIVGGGFGYPLQVGSAAAAPDSDSNDSNVNEYQTDHVVHQIPAARAEILRALQRGEMPAGVTPMILSNRHF